MKPNYFILLIFILLTACQKERISIGNNVSDTFFLDNHSASMRVLVEGNTKSRVFLILVHGGPGESSYFYESDYLHQNLENNLAMVFWDQRNAGASQGNANGSYLTLDQMSDDLKKLIQLIKSRYGESSSIFILGHSFGGLLTTSFLTSGENQSMIKGWIVVDGSHNYLLNDSLTRQKLVNTGREQLLLKNNSDFWEQTISFCQTHADTLTPEESKSLESYAGVAEQMMDSVNIFDIESWIESNAIKEKVPLTSVLVNYLYSSQSDLINQIQKAEFTSKLGTVTVPTLLLYGKYDFVCPPELGQDLFNRIGSENKRFVISPVSGHNLFYQDQVLFCKEVNEFIKRFQ